MKHQQHFVKPESNIIFISGPQDTEWVRNEIDSEVVRSIDQFRTDLSIKPYSWKIDLPKGGFPLEKAMQTLIFRPSDTKCIGVFAVLGESIGRPLNEVPPELEERFNDWINPRSKYKLVTSWPETFEEQKKLVEAGRYPLSGTVFEILDAILEKKKTKLFLIANKKITSRENKVRLGNSKWYASKIEELGPESKEFLEWKSQEYFIQTTAVRNFIRALSYRDRDHEVIQDAQGTKPIVAYYVNQILKEKLEKNGNHNPYRYLGAYNLDDTGDFYGRDELTQAAINSMWNLINSDDNNIMCFKGQSGAGKSSFLKAGFLGELKKQGPRKKILTSLLHPSDFPVTGGSILEMIADKLMKEVGMRIDKQFKSKLIKQRKEAAGWLVQQLDKHLESQEHEAIYVIGIDQFEEIIDVLTRDISRAYWDPFIRFIAAIGKSKRTMVAFTLESTREPALMKYGIPNSISKCKHLEVPTYNELFFERIIKDPFREAGYPLSSTLVERLIDGIKELRSGDLASGETSILPLVSLKLSQLFDEIKLKKPQAEIPLDQKDLSAFREGPSQDEIQVEDLEDPALNFKSLIEDEAHIAWREGTDLHKNNPEEMIDWFLQPLVAIHPETAKLQLQTIPMPVYHVEKKLIQSFINHRLILPTPSGFRLIHEAVIRDWPEANSWFDARIEFMKTKAEYKEISQKWARERISIEITEETIDAAAEILHSNNRVWFLSNEDGQEFSAIDQSLKEYCLYLFSQSKTPSKVVDYMGKPRTTHVHLAAICGLNDLLENFKKASPSNLEIRDPRNEATPLYGAAWGQKSTVAFLLENGVNPLAKNKDGWGAIFGAIQMNRLDILQLFLGSTDVNEQLGPLDITPLHWCAKYGNLEMASALISHNFNDSAEDKWKRTPLCYAAEVGNEEMFEFFMKRNPSDLQKLDKFRRSVLHYAAQNGHLHIVKILFTYADFDSLIDCKDEYGMTAFHLAVERNHYPIVQLLVTENNANEIIDSSFTDPRNGLPPIHLAISRRYDVSSDDPERILKIIGLLLDHGADPNMSDSANNTLLALSSKLLQVQILLIRHPEINPLQVISPFNATPLSLSIKLKDWETTLRLLDKTPGLPQGIVDEHNNTLLHLVLENKAPDEITELIFNGTSPCDLNRINNRGFTPLLKAIESHNWESASQILTSPNLEPMCKGERLSTPFISILESVDDYKNHIDLIQNLIELRPNLLHISDYFGWTPLHWAVDSQNLDLCRWICDQASDSEVLWKQPDHLGRLPSSLASRMIRKEFSLSDTADSWPAPQSWDSPLQWEEIPEKDSMIKQFSENQIKYNVDQSTHFHMAVLPFYDPHRVRILRVQSPKWVQKHLTLYFLINEDKMRALDGTSSPIHQCNYEVGINLTQDNVLDYLRFFCFFVRGDEGAFLIAEGIEQKEIPKSLSKKEGMDLKKILRPAIYQGYDQRRKEFLAQAKVYYSNHIFGARFIIEQSGMIKMHDDNPIMNDLSKKIERPIA